MWPSVQRKTSALATNAFRGSITRPTELPVNASRPGSPQAHASLGSGWRPTLAGWDWMPTGFRIRFRRLRHVILSPLTGLFQAHALVHESELARTDPDPQLLHRPMRYDIGLPSPVI